MRAGRLWQRLAHLLLAPLAQWPRLARCGSVLYGETKRGQSEPAQTMLR